VDASKRHSVAYGDTLRFHKKERQGAATAAKHAKPKVVVEQSSRIDAGYADTIGWRKVSLRFKIKTCVPL
jgi:hypothetical protein